MTAYNCRFKRQFRLPVNSDEYFRARWSSYLIGGWWIIRVIRNTENVGIFMGVFIIGQGFINFNYW